jgi:hypothetical protein
LVVACKVVVHLHNLVAVDNNRLVVVDNRFVVVDNLLDCIADNLLVDLEVDNKVEHLPDKIAVVVEEVDHNLVVHKRLLLVHNHLVVDNN